MKIGQKSVSQNDFKIISEIASGKEMFEVW